MKVTSTASKAPETKPMSTRAKSMVENEVAMTASKLPTISTAL